MGSYRGRFYVAVSSILKLSRFAQLMTKAEMRLFPGTRRSLAEGGYSHQRQPPTTIHHVHTRKQLGQEKQGEKSVYFCADTRLIELIV